MHQRIAGTSSGEASGDPEAPLPHEIRPFAGLPMLSRRRNATERNVEESLNEATCCCGVNQVRRLEGTATTRKRMTTDHSSSQSRRRTHLLSCSCGSLEIGRRGEKVVQRIKSCWRGLHHPEKLTFHLLDGRAPAAEHVRCPGGLHRWISRPRT